MTPRPSNREFPWFVELFWDLKRLERLELEGECEDTIRWLYREVTEGTRSLLIKTLSVPCGEHGRRRVIRLKFLGRGKDGSRMF